MKRKIYLLILILLFLITAKAFAGTKTTLDITKLNQQLATSSKNIYQTNYETKPSTNIFFTLITWTIYGLIFAGLIFFIRIKLVKQTPKTLPSQNMKILDSLYFSEKPGIHLVEIGEKFWAIGVTEHKVKLLFEITDKKLIEKIKLNDNTNKNAFNKYLDYFTFQHRSGKKCC